MRVETAHPPAATLAALPLASAGAGTGEATGTGRYGVMSMSAQRRLPYSQSYVENDDLFGYSGDVSAAWR